MFVQLHLFGTEQKYTFTGAYDHHVELTVYPRQPAEARHVVMLALFRGQLLFTRHVTRGLEWPGGKVELGETPLEGVIRELREETGAEAQSSWLVAQYTVSISAEEAENSSPSFFVKNVYVTNVEVVPEKWDHASDTTGHALLQPHVRPTAEAGFSPLVCDHVFYYVRRHVLGVQ